MKPINNAIINITDIIIFDDVSLIDLYDEKDMDGDLATEALSEKFIFFDKTRIDSVLAELKLCSNIHQEDYYKQNSFLHDNNLTLSDCKNILHNLTADNYVRSADSINPEHTRNILHVFEPKQIINNHHIRVYLKIDYDDISDEASALVSIHIV